MWIALLSVISFLSLNSLYVHQAWADANPNLPRAVDGRLNFEFELPSRIEQSEFEKEAQIEFQTRRDRGLRATADLELSDDSGGIDLREVYLDAKIGEEGRFRIGRAKKEFGLGWDQGIRERLGLTRGAVYEKLAGFAFVGRDTTLGFRYGDLDHLSWSNDLSIHTSEGLNGAMLHVLKLRSGSRSRFSIYTLLQSDFMNNHWRSSHAHALAYSGRHGHWRLESEFFYGTDSVSTQLDQRRGENGKTRFTALSLATAYEKWRSQPYLRVGTVLHDLSDPAYQTHELSLGGRHFFQPNLYLGAEINVRRTRSGPLITPSGVDSATGARLALRYFFL